MIRKLKSRNGESIAEVLVATLIAALATVMFASMVTASENMVRKSDTAYDNYVKDRRTIADNYGKRNKGVPATVTISSPDGSVNIRSGSTVKSVIRYQDPQNKYFIYSPDER